MSELTCLELSMLLWMAHVGAVAGAGRLELPVSYLASSRDKPAAPRGLVFGRAQRALTNYVESLAVFVALDLAFIALHQSAGIWPTAWIVARIVYLPLYLFGVVPWRSVVWGVAFLAILGMLVRLAGWI